MAIKVLGTPLVRLGAGEWRVPAVAGPEANPDFATATAGGEALIIAPLGNDIDQAGGGLLIAEINVDGVSLAAGASASIVSAGTQISFTPPSSAMTSTINYTVVDANGLPASSTVEVDVIGESSGVSVTIIANRKRGTSPAGLMFEAVAVGFDTTDPKRELRYLWNFGDPDSLPFSGPDERFDATVNGVELGWRESNLAYTYRAGHVFAPPRAAFSGTSPKEYVVRCTVRDRSGTQAEGLVGVTIDNPDVVFAGTTRGVIPSGNPTAFTALHPGAPWHATFDAAFAAAGSTARILIEPGATITKTTVTVKGRNKFQIGSWGDWDDPRPEFDLANGGGNGFVHGANANAEIAYFNFDMTGDWNVITESSPSGQNGIGAFNYENKWEAGFDTLYNIGISQVGSGITNSGGGASQWARHQVFGNVRISNFREYGVRQEGGDRMAWLGCAIIDNPLKKGGRDDAKSGRWHEHGPYRLTKPRAGSWHIFDGWQLQSWAGWPGMDASYPLGAYPAKINVPAPQSCMRFNVGEAKGTFWEEAEGNFTRFIMEGGNTVFLAPQQPEYPTNIQTTIVMDKGIIICGATAVSAISINQSGAIVTNVLAVAPRMNLVRAQDEGAMISLANGNALGNRVRGITQLNWIDPVENRHGGATPIDFDEWDGKTYGKFASLWHYPNGLVPNDLSSQLNLSFALFAPRYVGINFFDHNNYNGYGAHTLFQDFSYAAQDTFTQDGDTQSSIVMPVPIAGLTTTRAAAPIDDIFGNIRPATPHLGCVEPASVGL